MAAAVAAVLVAAVLVAAAPASGSEDDAVDIGVLGSPVQLVAPEGTTIEVEDVASGRTWRLAETVEVLRAGDGSLVLVNDISMQTYLEGIAEVPVGWPMEALKAQVVAARTYAWNSIVRGSWAHFDICATVACQVFRGRDVVRASGGERWAEAVAATDREVLLHDGGPILARYFSTSGGSTRNNETVFPSSGPRPYLKAVDDPEDEVSPLHTWEVTFTRDEMDAVLERGETLRAAAPVASIEVIPAGGGHPDRLRVTGTHGRSVVLNASTFRGHVSRVAPDLFPERFPPAYPDSDRRFPETLPSSRFEVTVTDDEVVFDGRGYGHGVGMSQYGALGKAEQGMSYDDILASYYQGIRPVEAAAVPDRVRAGLETDRAAFTVRADGPVRLVAGGRVVTERAMGLWRLERATGGIRVTAPAGFGASLVVAPTEASLPEPSELHTFTVETVVNKPAELALVVYDPDGAEASRAELGVVDRGYHSLEVRAAALGPGEWRVGLRAADEAAVEEGDPTSVEVRAVQAAAGRPETLLAPPPVRDSGPLPLALAGTIGAVAGLLLAGRTGRRT
jgi:SpoIID/LytB domain protein